MEFGLYIHIPFCLQRCYYCDFATYTQSEIKITPDEYLHALIDEIQKGSNFLNTKKLTSLYFGGGTPSLLSLSQFEIIFKALHNSGWSWDKNTEVTIEINPATLDVEKISELQNWGVNRFSVGAQTFDDKLLKQLNRKHSAHETRMTLDLLAGKNINYSFDLLFALPNQTLEQLQLDLDELTRFKAPHVSPYYLTLQSNHFLNQNRPEENTEVAMFHLIRDFLCDQGYEQYEISNFSKPGFHSKHNYLYWNDSSYWGVGLSSSSYFNNLGPWGTRTTNLKQLKNYMGWVTEWNPKISLFEGRLDPAEELDKHESLTDWCHTSLRTSHGIEYQKLAAKFGLKLLTLLDKRSQNGITAGWLNKTPSHLFLTDLGKDLSNQVFLDFTFSASDLESLT